MINAPGAGCLTSGVVSLTRPLPLERGGVLHAPEVAYRLHGPTDAPVVLVLGGISSDRHVTSCADEPRSGWWQDVVGDGRALDTTRLRVLTVDYLDGVGVPSSAGPHPGVASVTTCDQARAIVGLLNVLGIETLHAAVGASYGGMVVLALAERHAERVRRAVVFGAAHEPHPMATAHRSIQRRIVRLGLAGGNAREAVRIARALAMTTYRTIEEFAGRFDAAPEPADGPARYPVESYLEHCGDRFADRFTPERFLCLSESVDLHRVDPAEVRVPVTLVAVEGDTLVPPWQMRVLAEGLPDCRRLHTIVSRYGHDAFLKEASVAAIVGAAVTGDG